VPVLAGGAAVREGLMGGSTACACLSILLGVSIRTDFRKEDELWS